MKKDEIIELLKEQIASLRADNDRLLLQVEALTQEIASLNEALLQKGESLSRQQRIAKGLAKLMSNSSEKQNAAQTPLSEEEQKRKEEEKAAKRKARKNNGARRDMHYDMEEVVHDVYPGIRISTERRPACFPPLQEYAYVTNVCRCVSRNMYTEFIPTRKTAGSLRARHRLPLS